MISLLVTSDGIGCLICAFHKSITNFSISSGLFPRESPSDTPFKTGKSRDNFIDFCEYIKPWKLQLIGQLIIKVTKKRKSYRGGDRWRRARNPPVWLRERGRSGREGGWKLRRLQMEEVSSIEAWLSPFFLSLTRNPLYVCNGK